MNALHRADVFRGHRSAMALLQRLMSECSGEPGPGFAILSSARNYLAYHDPERAWLTGRDRDTVQAEQEAAAPTLSPLDDAPAARPGAAALEAAGRIAARIYPYVATCPEHGTMGIAPGQTRCQERQNDGAVCDLTLTDGRD